MLVDELELTHIPKSLPFHPLSFEPGKIFDALSRNGYDSITTLCIVGQEIVIVLWNLQAFSKRADEKAKQETYTIPHHKYPA